MIACTIVRDQALRGIGHPEPLAMPGRTGQ
jgi:hypothetical protein